MVFVGVVLVFGVSVLAVAVVEGCSLEIVYLYL